MFTEKISTDPDAIRWEDLAYCASFPSDMADFFFEQYEEDAEIAQQVDQLCLSCPVAKLCLQTGISGGYVGVWGGVYLTDGAVDVKLNKHKTEEIWDEWNRSIGR